MACKRSRVRLPYSPQNKQGDRLGRLCCLCRIVLTFPLNPPLRKGDLSLRSIGGAVERCFVRPVTSEALLAEDGERKFDHPSAFGHSPFVGENEEVLGEEVQFLLYTPPPFAPPLCESGERKFDHPSDCFRSHLPCRRGELCGTPITPIALVSPMRLIRAMGELESKGK